MGCQVLFDCSRLILIALTSTTLFIQLQVNELNEKSDKHKLHDLITMREQTSTSNNLYVCASLISTLNDVMGDRKACWH